MVETDSKEYLELLQLIPSQDACKPKKKYKGITLKELTKTFNQHSLKAFLAEDEILEYLTQMVKDGRVCSAEKQSVESTILMRKPRTIYFKPYAPSDNYFGGGFLY
jgi:hypothetical protein